ncbi:MAG TPA: type III pantothenate kinase [Candidatus Cloacimonadota bacterium]|nr:type III pantothenate kinase [Candidatus Cloacimonadota bacterium]
MRKGNLKKFHLVIDAGNSNIVFGIYDLHNLINEFRYETKKLDFDEYYGRIFEEITQNIDGEIIKVALSSVVPEITDYLITLAEKFTNATCRVIDFNSDLGLSFPVQEISHIGSDLLVDAFAAVYKYKSNCIVCDLGTATTVQLIRADGFIYGYAILPGVVTSADCLFAKASKLKKIDLEKPQNILGTNTNDALLTGIINGHKFLLEGFITEIKAAFPELKNIKIIITGGLAEMVCNNSSLIDIVDKSLLLDGLNIICRNLIKHEE